MFRSAFSKPFAPAFGGAVAAAFTPAAVAGLTWWQSDYGKFQERTGASATTPATGNTDPVGTWASKYGTAKYWSATNDNFRLSNIANQLNNLPVLRADGVNDFLNLAEGYPTNFCIFVVVKKAASGSTQYLLKSNYVADDGQTYFTSADKFHPLGAVTANSFTVTDWNIIQFSRTGTNGIVRINGGAGESLAVSGNTDTILSLAGSSGGFALAGDIAAVGIADSDLGLADINNIGLYINTLSGLTWNTAV